jgi:hypothetical protein
MNHQGNRAVLTHPSIVKVSTARARVGWMDGSPSNDNPSGRAVSSCR